MKGVVDHTGFFLNLLHTSTGLTILLLIHVALSMLCCSILTVHVRGTELKNDSVLRGCLHLVDLAGSERVDRSEADSTGLRSVGENS